ncbi:hypothetical protein [Herbidospora sp. NBRC 101105]|uniref:hypothetical protein n=1 Tax=Herbidospora sp. NBRC 101105 TaxID=3032195 RepID=UPI0024A2918B|nr:hypothetical protein [Herbidospora sp. NBRC 101105]GLX99492.1 hypothetical protein Hesp01_74420 [Herbidospora sp. NBRC 101105]
MLERAREDVRRDRGAASIDRVALADVEEYGVTRLPDELAAEPATPRPGSGERRPLPIPSVRDRIVQAAVKPVLEPISEADTLDCSFGLGPDG